MGLRPQMNKYVFFTFVAAVMIATSFTVGASQTTAPTSDLSGQIELARLVDLCAQRLNLNIEYDPAILKGSLTLRLGGGFTDDEIWSLTNRILSAHGLTTVRMPGDQTLSVVRIGDAPGLSEIREEPNAALAVGYTSIVLRLESLPASLANDIAKPLLSKAGGSLTLLGDSGLILISDLSPRVDQIVSMLAELDVPGEAPLIEQVVSKNLSATHLSALVTASITARNEMARTSIRGKLTASPDGGSVILVAPPRDAQQWKALIDRFDQREAVETRTYSPRHFAIDAVANLIEQSVRGASPGSPAAMDAGQRWRLVRDELTGSLMITATPTQHEQIGALMARLDSVPAEARRPMRTFPIRNRSVTEILGVLQQLVAIGVLETAGESVDAADSSANGAGAANDRPPASLQVTQYGAGATSLGAPSMDGADAAKGDAGSVLQRGSSQPRVREEQRLILTADEGTSTIIALGEARLLEQLEDLIATLDVRQPQVMIEVMVASLTEGDTLDLGVELSKLNMSGNTLISLASLFGLGEDGVPDDPVKAGTGFSGVVLNPGDYSVVVRALQTINDGKSVSLPKVLVNNNQQATLNSVQQEPFLSTNASNTVTTTSFGGTQDAGTTVTVKPQIAEGDHLVLEYSVAISSFTGESSDPSLPPPRQQNNLQSIVTIPDGYTIVVGGLEVTTHGEAISQVPLIGSIPLLGELFKRRSKSASTARFFVFIRCNVLRHSGFEDLKYLSDRDVFTADVDSGWPTVEPRIIY